MRRSTKRLVFLEFIYFVHYIYVCFQLVAFIREHVWYKAFLMWYSRRLELTLNFQYKCLLSGQTGLI